MTVSKFMAIQEALQPDWFQCLSDGEASCADATSIKRARKSVDRSLQFLDSCLRLQEESEVRLPISPSVEALTSLLLPDVPQLSLRPHPCSSLSLPVLFSFAEPRMFPSPGFHHKLFTVLCVLSPNLP